MILKIIPHLILTFTLVNCSKENRSDIFLNFYGPDTNESCFKKSESDSCYDKNISNVTVLDTNLSDVKSEVNFLHLWNSIPKILVPSNSDDPVCRRDSVEFLKGLNRTELWALKSLYIIRYYFF